MSSAQTASRVAGLVRRRARRVERTLHRSLLRYPATVACPVCGWSGPAFGAGGRPRHWNRLCPSCGSSERYRALELFLDERGPVPPGTRLLEVAPIDTVRTTAERLGYTYTSIDLSSRRAITRADLCRLPFPDATFDIAVCFHVLEHIPADDEALKELARVVGPDGQAVISDPVRWERHTTFEDPTAEPADYERIYGQSDHVRIYGADVAERWTDPEIDLREVLWTEQFDDDTARRAALRGDDDRFWFVRSASTR